MNVDFTFSDTIAGYVSSYNSRESSFTLRTSDDREFTVYLNSNTYARYAYNLTESYQDATGDMPRLLALPRQFVYAYGTFLPAGESGRFEAQWLVFPGNGPGVYRQEEPSWWINQSRSIGNSYLKWQFNHPERGDQLPQLPDDAASRPEPRRAASSRKPTPSAAWSMVSRRLT